MDELEKRLRNEHRGEDGRRLRGKTIKLWAAALRVFEDQSPPMTVRQVFYRLVATNAIPKTENGYKRVSRELTKMRRRGVIPYAYITDNTRWVRRPRTYSDLADCLLRTRDFYRRDLWQQQEAYVELWVEKDALAGVFYDVTAPWGVPLYVARGYSSETLAQSAAEELKSQAAAGKTCHVYYFGDLDPSGVDATRSAVERMRGFGAVFNFYRPAVTRQQIEDWGLPTRPTKRSDSRSKGWRGGSVDLDAVPVDNLRQLAEYCITRHIDPDAWHRAQAIEAAEREALAEVVANMG